MTPRSEAIAFQIWAYATPLGWDCTVNEIADELGIPWRTVANICQAKRWNYRIRHGLSQVEYSLSLAHPGGVGGYRTHKHEVLRDLGLSHA